MITRKGLAASVNTKSFKIGDEEITFIGKKDFPGGKLPTKKDVIVHLLWEKNWHTKESATRILQEIIDIWVFCTVYPTSNASVQKKVLELVDTFNKLIKYPKAKRNQSFEEKVKDFSRNSETLFDIFCYDNKKRSEIEKSCNLKMTESEFKLFEDQKGLRLAKCIKVQEKLSACELRFQERCSYEAQFHQPSTSSTYTETMSLSSGSDSEVLISETTSCEFYEPSAKKQKSDSVQNSEHYFYLA